jgi:hypothetical protein
MVAQITEYCAHRYFEPVCKYELSQSGLVFMAVPRQPGVEECEIRRAQCDSTTKSQELSSTGHEKPMNGALSIFPRDLQSVCFQVQDAWS